MKLPVSTGEFFDVCYFDLTGEKAFYDTLPRGEFGKPEFPAGFGRKFSVSHSGDFGRDDDAILAVAFADVDEAEDIGMDIELRRHRSKLTEQVLRRILAPGEKAVNGEYLNNFVIKEAFAKLTGKGLGMGFREYDANELIKKYRAADLSDDKYVWWILQGLNL